MNVLFLRIALYEGAIFQRKILGIQRNQQPILRMIFFILTNDLGIGDGTALDHAQFFLALLIVQQRSILGKANITGGEDFFLHILLGRLFFLRLHIAVFLCGGLFFFGRLFFRRRFFFLGRLLFLRRLLFLSGLFLFRGLFFHNRFFFDHGFFFNDRFFHNRLFVYLLVYYGLFIRNIFCHGKRRYTHTRRKHGDCRNENDCSANSILAHIGLLIKSFDYEIHGCKPCYFPNSLLISSSRYFGFNA